MSVAPISLAEESLFGQQPEGHSSLRQQGSTISADGQLLVFQSDANDLAPNDTNKASNSNSPLSDVFLFNRGTGQTSLLSVNAAGTASGDNSSFNPKISADGRYVLFQSEAGNLTSQTIITGGGHPDIFLRDLQTGATTLISIGMTAATGGNAGSHNANISADGRYVVFESGASNLVADDTNGRTDIFLRDLVAGTTTLISRKLNDTVGGNGHSVDPRISDDGRFIAFTSFADDLVANDGTNVEDVYVYDRQTGTTELITVDSDEVNQSNAHNALSSGRAFSADGRYVLFETNASNLFPNTSGPNVYLRDRQLGTTTVVSIAATGLAGAGGAAGSMTPDGRYVAFVSGATSLVTGVTDTNGAGDVFLRDMQTGITRLVSSNSAGTGTGDRWSGTAQYPFDFVNGAPELSDDGRFVAFASEASNLVAGISDGNDSRTEVFGTRRRDVFVRDMQLNSTIAVSLNRTGAATGENGSYTPAMSADGKIVAFESHASDLLNAQDNGGYLDVFARDLATGQTELASQRTPLFPDWRLNSTGGALTSATADGRFVAFTSNSCVFVRDLHTGQVMPESVNPDGSLSVNSGYNGRLSADGRFIVFGSNLSLASAGPQNVSGRNQIFVRDRQLGQTRLVSITPSGQPSLGNEWTSEIAFSPDGRYAVWSSSAQDLVDGFVDGNGTSFTFGVHDLFLRDLHTGVTRLVSHVPGNPVQSGNGASFRPTFSANGSKLIFISAATDLVAGQTDANAGRDVFAYDVASGQIELVSANSAGTGAGDQVSGNDGWEPVISADGRYVAFGSQATNLAPSDNSASNYVDIFLRDLVSQTTTLVSINAAGALSGNQSSFQPSISADGRYVAFASNANDLVAGDTARTDVFVRDVIAGTTTRASVNLAGGQSSGNASLPLISPDGGRVSFFSGATDLVANFVDGNVSRDDLYVRDLASGLTDLVSINYSGTASANDTISAGTGTARIFTTDGGTLFFTADASNLVLADRNFVSDVFAYQFSGAGQIRGKLFNDTDRDGTQDAGENGIQYWTVYLDENGNRRFDGNERNVQTDAAGNYAFTGLAAGTSTIALNLLDGYTRTAPAAPGTHTVTLNNATEIVIGRDFAAAAAQVDLEIAAVAAPPAGSVGREITVSWTARNLGSDAIAGDWQDAIYLSADGQLDASDQLLAVVPHVGGLGTGASYTTTLSLALPPVAGGNYQLIVETDRRHQVIHDTNRGNNLGDSAPVAISLSQLTLGVPFVDQFTTANQDRYFQVTVAAGDSLTVLLDSAAQSGSTELYVRRLQLPTTYEFDFASRGAGQPDQALTVPVTLPGTYYVLARSRAGAAGSSTFTVTATQPVFGMESVSPNTGGNTGKATVEIRGTKLTPNTQVSLMMGAATLNATNIDFRDSSLLYVTFDLTGQPAGNYDVTLTSGSNSVTLPSGFAVTVGQTNQASQLQVFLTTPEDVRLGREGKLLVDYVNTGTNDIVAPLLRITADHASFRWENQQAFASGEIYLLGIAPSGPAGVLRPGQRGQIELPFLSSGPAGEEIHFEIFVADSSAEMDWSAAKAAMRPDHIPSDAWDAVFANFTSVVGTTVADYQSLLAEAASYLSQVGVYTSDVTRLLAFEISKASGAFTAQSLASVEESRLPTPGVDLSFTRTQLQSISGRYHLGPFGRGWTHNWDIEATTHHNGDVELRVGDSTRYFTKQPDGSYRGGIGNHATLSLVGGVLTLTESNSTQWTFHPDGLLNFIEEDNGNRVTAGYTARRLTSLTHTSGAAILLSYNAQGRIEQLADTAGQTVVYGYDAAGEHLISYTDKYGTHQYTYLTGQGAAREHALASIDFSDDTHRQFTYDAQGRLIQENRDGGLQATSYTYLPGGGFAVTDATGGTTTLLQDDAGLVRRSIDPLGHVIDLAYDSRRNLIQTNLPLGVQYAYHYDARGNMTSMVDPLGYVTEFAYDARDNLLSMRDARGNTTHYSYDTEDNLRAITYANGAVEQFDYDPLGNLTQKTNRRGGAIDFTHNSRGQLVRKDYADGAFVEYGYDARGNLIAATDADGTAVLSYNGLDALERIDYPDGRFLQFTYNTVAQRTSSVDQDGFVVNYHYDDLGRLQRLTNGGDELIEEYIFDAAGRVLRENHGNNTATTYEYDPAGRLLRIRHLASDGVTANSFFEYTYDALGRRTSETTADGTTTYGYDALGQLTSVSVPGGRIITYAYDAVGNRTSVNDDGVTTLYQTNELNQYTQVGDAVYVYDADGNLVSKVDPSGATSYTFNDENRLISVAAPGLSALYTYNALGHRNSSTINGQRTDYLIDPVGISFVAAEYSGANLIAHYTVGLGLSSRVDAVGNAAYYDFDAVGNTAGITDTLGQYVNRYTYLPFGEITAVTAALANPFTFVGRSGVIDDGSGSFSMRLRSYDPELGRFAAQDPIGLRGQDANLYRYVWNNPVSFIDPEGLQGQGGGGAATTHFGPSPRDRKLPPTLNAPVCPTPHTQQKPKPKPSPSPNPEPPKIYVYPPTPDVPYGIEPDGYTDDGIAFVYGPRPGDPPNGGGTGGPGGCCGDCPPGPPPPAPGGSVGGGSTGPRGSFDPNDISGPTGFGEEHFVTPEQTLPYTIRFENDPVFATAPAQEVFVTHQLDTDLDWSSVELGDVGFGDVVIDVPDGVQSYQTRVSYQNQDGSPLLVDLAATLDLATGVIAWTFRSVDPLTGFLPLGVFDGFLPVNDETHRGEGFIRYKVRPQSALPTGTAIDQQASIVFDVNEPVVTNLYTNTIDSGAPASSVAALPATTYRRDIALGWSGADDAGGSGIAAFDIFVSVDNGPYTLLLDDTTATSSVYLGDFGHTYRFYSVASDNVGQTEAAPAGFDAIISLVERPSLLVTAADAGGGPHVRVLDPGTLAEHFGFYAYDPGFTGGVRVATGDINGDGALDIITAAGPGGGPHVRVFDGLTGVQLPGTVGNFYAYDPAFSGGVFVASADVNGDNRDDIITGAGAGGGPHVRVFSGVDGAELMGFYAYDSRFSGGVSVAAGFVDGDDRADIITGAGAGGGPHVKVIGGSDGAELMSFFAYAPQFAGGVYVASGDVNGDSQADIITGAGAGGGPHVRVIDGGDGSELHSFFAYDPAFTGGVRVASSDLNGDDLADIITAAGPGGGPHVRGFSGQNLAELVGLFAFSPNFAGGVHVAGSVGAPPAEPLRLAGPVAASNGQIQPIAMDDLTAIAAAAIERWSGAGLPEALQQQLHQTRLEIVDLPGDLLGLAISDRVLIDSDAAGQGWFIDSTPLIDEEFTIPERKSPAQGVDLLTVVLHELGHRLGLEHPANDLTEHLMSSSLERGVRPLPNADVLDAWFASAEAS
jgi:RHS repeat-associated protein